MKTKPRNLIPGLRAVTALVALGCLTLAPQTLKASSHMDAPLITLDPAANTTDVYAFVSSGSNNAQYLTVAVSVYPFEEPGIGPNLYNFDPNVLYEIHVATGSDLAAGKSTLSYQFRFKTTYKNQETILPSYLGSIAVVGDSNQNLVQTYTVTKRVRRNPTVPQVLFSGNMVPPNNQGLVTPLYNQSNDGENPAKDGVSTDSALDSYTKQTVYQNRMGYQVFAGQRDDDFYADIQSIFDLDFSFSGPNKPFDSQSGFNVHTIVLNIPMAEIGGTNQVVGVYATTSRQKTYVLRTAGVPFYYENVSQAFVQVGRQGNPLFNEALVAIRDRDRWSQSPPSVDAQLFKKYALTPTLAAALGLPSNLQTNRTDIAGIFIPDMLKVDLSTGPARLAGNMGFNGGVADDKGFNRLGIFGGGTNAAGGATFDVLHSSVQVGFLNAGVLPGGWPNGRRFGDDVVDIAVLALASDLRNPASPTLATAPADPGVDKVDHNDIGYNKVFPFAATPHNGRAHQHNPPVLP